MLAEALSLFSDTTHNQRCLHTQVIASKATCCLASQFVICHPMALFESSGHCGLQLFLLFLVHAYGSRTWKVPQRSSRRLLAPGEAAFQPPEGQTQLIMDGPWHLNWPCLIPWLLMEAAHSIAWLRNATASGSSLECIKCHVQLMLYSVNQISETPGDYYKRSLVWEISLVR